MTEEPFETNDDGQYLITAPFQNTVPDEITIALDGTSYRLYGFAGKDITSTQYPDVLAYKYCESVDTSTEASTSSRSVEDECEGVKNE